ncbi:hypothetical protein T484DRAFT_1850173 [Baffinella frigidus]|nr:hypothetical protein T484DRAFT_1850173 [Cryptophyta sp. CCMP2293]
MPPFRALAAAVLGVVVVVAVVYVSTSQGKAPEMSLLQKKSQLRAHAARLEELHSIRFGATTLGDTGTEEGNRGFYWNYGANFGGHKKAGTYLTSHGRGIGMHGKWGVDDDSFFMKGFGGYDDRAAGDPDSAVNKKAYTDPDADAPEEADPDAPVDAAAADEGDSKGPPEVLVEQKGKDVDADDTEGGTDCKASVKVDHTVCCVEGEIMSCFGGQCMDASWMGEGDDLCDAELECYCEESESSACSAKDTDAKGGKYR